MKRYDLIVFLDLHNPFANFMKTILLDLPFSRKCESEADYIGLMLMAKSCYNPEEATKLWKRMSKVSPSAPAIGSFLSTHPSHSQRIENIESWLSEAQVIYNSSDCHNQQWSDFNKMFKR